MSPLVEPLDVAVASQKSVSGFQLASQQVQEVTGKVAPPVVELTHDDVSGSLGTSRGDVTRNGEKGDAAQFLCFH